MTFGKPHFTIKIDKQKSSYKNVNFIKILQIALHFNKVKAKMGKN